MAGMAWFRMYAEFATDPKIQMLSESLQRRFVMLLCLKCNGGVTLQDEEVTFLLRISNEEWAETKAIFVAKNMLDTDNNLTNWDKRQYKSDSSVERVKKHRDKKKRPCNVTVTPPDTDTDTDTDTEKKTPKPPLPETREYPAWLNRKLWGDFRAWRSEKGRPLSIIEESTALEQLRSFRESGQDIDAVIRQSIVQNWPGLFPVKGGEKVKKIGTPKTVTAANGVAYDF